MWPFVLDASHVFVSELFDIVNIGKRDADGAWRRADLVTGCTFVMIRHDVSFHEVTIA